MPGVVMVGSETQQSSRRAFTTLAVAAAAAGVASEAKAQYASGEGHYVPYNCNETSIFGVTGGGPIFGYTCNPVSDNSLLTLLLNFEYLEASYYAYATTGYGLPVADQGGQPIGVMNGAKANLTDPTVAAMAQQLANDERSHVELLRRTIIATSRVPASLPGIDFQLGFTAIMQQAGLVASGQTFNAFANDTNFLLGAYILEDLNVSLYRGVANFVSKPYLDLVTGMLATEGYHAGIVRSLCFTAGLANQTNAISHARSTLDGSAGTPMQGNDHGVGTSAQPSVVDADSSSIVASRTQVQAIDIVFSVANATSPTLGFPQFFFFTGLSNPT